MEVIQKRLRDFPAPYRLSECPPKKMSGHNRSNRKDATAARRLPRYMGTFVLAALLLITAAGSAKADDGTEQAGEGKTAADGQRVNDSGLWDRASGAWQDIQSQLDKRGIALSFNYTGEVFYSYRLEPDKVTPYRDLTNLRIDLDTEKLGLWPGGEVFLNGQWSYGRGIDVMADGVTFPISSIDARNFAQVSEYGLKQRFWNNALQVIVGKQDVNTIFCVNDYGSLLVNNSYIQIPTVPLPTFPAPGLGATVIASPWKQFSFGLGFYEGAPRIGGSGFDTFFDGSRGYFSILETKWTPAWGQDHHLPGDYRVGFWYHTGQFAGIGDDTRTFNGNYGFYLLMNQSIYRRKGADPSDPGLGVFLQAGWAPSDRNQVTRYVGAGLQYQGIVPGRPADILGLATSYTWVTDGEHETMLVSGEFFYLVQITSWLGVQPDIQYFYNARGEHRSGLAAGCRWVVQF
jgi:porin